MGLAAVAPASGELPATGAIITETHQYIATRMWLRYQASQGVLEWAFRQLIHSTGGWGPTTKGGSSSYTVNIAEGSVWADYPMFQLSGGIWKVALGGQIVVSGGPTFTFANGTMPITTSIAVAQSNLDYLPAHRIEFAQPSAVADEIPEGVGICHPDPPKSSLFGGWGRRLCR